MSKSKRHRQSSRRLPPIPIGESADSFWRELNLRINKGNVVPIISNSVRNDHIFDIDFDYNIGLAKEEQDLSAEELTIDEELAEERVSTRPLWTCPNCGQELTIDEELAEERAEEDEEKQDLSAEELTIDEELAEQWAKLIGYPFPDRHRLARVAVYNRIESDDDESAKRKYLRFLKEYLLYIAQEYEDEDVSNLAAGLRGQVDTLRFPEIANQLDYPRFEEGRQDPLRLLARLPLPLYVTTSYYEFMERALVAEGRRPRTQICFLSDEPENIASEHRSDPNIILSTEEPLVYHLHGLERYPESLVLSEDDYVEFLDRIAREGKDSNTPFVPFYLWEALSKKSLVLLGYRLHDWDFRVLFLGLVKPYHNRLHKSSLAVQFDPAEQKTVKDDVKARGYLEDYFKPCQFRVKWGTADDFIRDLYKGWDEWRTNQA